MTENSDIKWDSMSDKAVLSTIGAFIKETRLSQNKSQQQLADDAGIARSTLTLLESGSGGTLLSMIQALRMLGQLHLFGVFEIPEQISPLLLAKQAEQKRSRASGSLDRGNDTVNDQTTW